MALRASAARQYGDSKVQVDKVNFIGISRTKSDALLSESKQLFLQKTFNDLVMAAYETKRHMEKVGLFNNLDVLIDVSKKGEPNYVVHYLVREPTARAVVNGNVNNRGEAGMGIEGSLGSVFGRGELLSAEANIGH